MTHLALPMVCPRLSQMLSRERTQVDHALAGTSQGWTYHASRADPVRLIATVAEKHDGPHDHHRNPRRGLRPQSSDC
jgi:hypothetical protein